MNKAAFGDALSRYHLEAAIAYEHCTAESFEKTNWERILALYNWLCQHFPSPIAELNRAVIILQLHGAPEALATLEGISDKKKMENFYLYNSLLGEVYARLNEPEKARIFFEAGIHLTKSESEKKLLKEKIALLDLLS